MAGIPRTKLLQILMLLVGVAGIGLLVIGARMVDRPINPRQQFPVYEVNLSPGSRVGTKLPLAGAKNEYLSLYFRVSQADPASLRVTVKQPAAGSGISYKLYQVCPVPAIRGSNIAPNALVPLDQGLKNYQPLDIWVTLKTSASLPAGLQVREIVFADKRGQVTIPVEIRVWNFALPDDLPISILGNLWGDPGWFKPYGVNSTARFDQVIREYLRVMREYKFNALGPEFYPLPVSQVRPGGKVEDFPGYHAMLNYALNNLGYRSFCLPRLKMGKPALQDPAKFKPLAQQYYPVMRDYLRRHNWENRAYNKILDEPRAPYYPSVYEVYAISKGLMPAVKTMCTGLAPDLRLVPVINVWVAAAMRFNDAQTAAAQRQGQQIWFYVNRLHKIFQPQVAPRLIGWLLYRYGFQGYYVWAVNHWRDVNPWDSRRQIEPFRTGGIFFYPNPRNGAPWPTVQLEAMRQGFQDYQYLALLEQARQRGRIAPQASEEIRRQVDSLVGGGLKKRVETRVTMADLEGLRYRIGAALDGRTP